MHDDKTTERAAWLILGGIRLLNQTAPRRPNDPIVFVRVAPQEVCLPSTTVAFRCDTLGVCPVDALNTSGTRLGRSLIDGGALFPDAIVGAALCRLLGADEAPGLVPLLPGRTSWRRIPRIRTDPVLPRGRLLRAHHP